jgi:enoyl-CoA hydratase/carnithine racemase
MEPILRMAFTGRHERMTASRAHQLGILSQVVDPPEDLRSEAGALAEKIAKNSPTAMAVTKKALWEALERDLTDACAAGARDLAIMWGHPDQEEGPEAFAAKREASWAPLDHTLLDVEEETR